ncbi:hypothetical protein G6F16_003127 [Rhizopus arrhizus]|nr:hypothetical protein G6F24_008909 [Rhizopus arrhizus]KAG0785285.1 hypothetical protein G6F21_009361 [Rhizopus arrhizus]KAG0801435.1 hypothetical protein G6F22_001249 [Rhizopus arrhizus]KAG0816816.1 hypothetical protein G6F20_002904 [Rhizopus arrhizus]KAG0830165.1 hypothetical protein G6F18_008288 [Rhizopus arrhizus]
MGSIQESNGCVVAWSNSNMDFSKSCVLIDEADINISMKSSRAWAPGRQMVVFTTSLTKAPLHLIIRAMSFLVESLSIRVL